VPPGAMPTPVTTRADDGSSLPLLVGAAAATIGSLVVAVVLFQHSNRVRAALARAVLQVGRGAQVRSRTSPRGKPTADESGGGRGGGACGGGGGKGAGT
jgi:hypothetical protein